MLILADSLITKLEYVENNIEQAMAEQGPTRDPRPTIGKISSVYLISF